MSQIVAAKRDTFINLMINMDAETAIQQGTRMFLITSDKQTRYLESDEICVYTPEHGLNYTYKNDWEAWEGF
jgi:ABC-type uncharacterized transport system auxiliary subunit